MESHINIEIVRELKASKSLTIEILTKLLFIFFNVNIVLNSKLISYLAFIKDEIAHVLENNLIELYYGVSPETRLTTLKAILASSPNFGTIANIICEAINEKYINQ